MILASGRATCRAARLTGSVVLPGLALMLTGLACQERESEKEQGSDVEDAAGTSIGLFEHMQHVLAMREGFQEISSDWDAFADQWAFADPVAFDALENEALTMHSTEDELRRIYRFRGALYQRLAEDSMRNVACGPQRTLGDVMNLLGDLRTETNMRQVGRSLARQHEGFAPWTPPVALPLDERYRDAFIQYLLEAGLTDAARTLTAVAEGGDVTNEALCVFQGTLYTLAANQPDDPVGDLRLLDYIRSLEASALPQR